jgi:hypothetical protein
MMKKIISLLVIGTMMTVGVSMTYAADPKVLPADRLPQQELTTQKNQPKPKVSKTDPNMQAGVMAGAAAVLVGVTALALSGDDSTTTPAHHAPAE